MRVVYKAPGEMPEVREITNDVESLQELVEGWIEHVKIKRGLGLIINEEGKLHRMPPNFYLAKINGLIVGPAVFVGEAGEDFTDISDDDIERVMLHFTEV